MYKFVGLILFFGIMSATAHALTFTDDFSGYNNYYIDITKTDNNSIWTAYLDSNKITMDTNYLKFGTTGLKNDVNVLRDPGDNNRASMYATIPQLDMTDYNAQGRAYYWMKLDGNCAQVEVIDLRFGTDSGHYWAYYDVGVFGEAFYCGYNLLEFDLNSAGGNIGFPTWNDYEWVEASARYGFNKHATDFNYTMNHVWAEKVTGSTNGVWQQLTQGVRPYGWHKPFMDGNEHALQIAPTDRSEFAKQAYVFVPQLGSPSIVSKDNNITMSADLKQMDLNQGTKFIFDWNTISTYNAVYVYDVNGSAARIGVESYVSNTRTFSESTVPFNTETYYTVKYVTDNNNVSVYLNNTLVHEGSVANRNVGDFGIDSNSGQTIIKNFKATFTQGGQPTQPGATTSFVFSVPVVRGISATYGGNCSATAFFFNEIDATSDPDADGNWNKSKPRPQRNLGETALLDYNTQGVTNPSTYPITYSRGDLGGAPTTGPTGGTEIDTNAYTAISADDSDINVLKVSTVTMVASTQTVFRINTDGKHVKDMNFTFIGESINGTNCQNGTGTKKTIPISFLNPATNNWDILLTIPGTGAVTGEKDAQYGEIVFPTGDANIEMYIASDRTVSVMISSAAAGGQAACLLTDRVKLTTNEYPLNTDFCQSSTLAPITVTNNGNQDVNVDMNLLTAFSGSDINLALKEWMGTGSGCGSDGNGLGGWEDTCSAAVTAAPTQTTCTVFTSANATTNHRVATHLQAGDTNQFCFSGETWTASLGTTFVGTGDHNQTTQTGANT